jgi:hypothetical protein
MPQSVEISPSRFEMVLAGTVDVEHRHTPERLMKQKIGQALLGLAGTFISLSGAMFLFNPEGAAAKLLLSPEGAEGLSNLRGFAGASVLAVGLGIVIAAITKNLANARSGALFVLLLLVARILSYVIDGPIDTIGLFLAIPSTVFVMMIAGHKLIESEG